MMRICLALTLTAGLQAQWLNQPSPGIPRTADGKPNLSTPAPRAADGKPDLSGLWGMNPGAYAFNIAADLKPEEIQPWARALYSQRMENMFRDDPYLKCLPQGPRINLYTPLMEKVVQTPLLIAILIEDLNFRQIFLDGRDLPKDPNPSFMGYSTGHWDGDTLVVESNGFNDKTWLDFNGHPHSEGLRITERFHRRDFGHMDIEETLSDPAIYARPWTITIKADLVPDTDMLEYICAENEQDRKHLVGQASDDKKYEVKVAPEILAQYVGTYEFAFPENPTTVIVSNIRMSGGQLFIDTEGKDPYPMIPLSETMFSILGDRIRFEKDEHGVVTGYVSLAAEGDLKNIRRPDKKPDQK